MYIFYSFVSDMAKGFHEYAKIDNVKINKK